MRTCRECGYEGPEFYGRDTACKRCTRERRRARYYEDPEAARAASRGWHGENRDRANARRGARRNANLEREREASRLYWSENRDAILAQQRERYATDEERRERVRAAARASRQRNPERRAETNRRDKRRRRLGRDPEACAYAEILRADPCAYCGNPTEEIDHVEPLAGDGTNDWTNLTGACASCNNRKRARPLLLFLLD